MDELVLGALRQAADASPDSASEPFVGRWQRLVSTTNWEKGRIISEWRTTLIDTGARPAEYSDEVWSLSVGGVTTQHVGRLRRVFQRFGAVFQQYPGLFWSHFQAAIDWDDAEMWLEGAVQNRWPVAHMRRKRWETLGAVSADKPRDNESLAVDLDEDYQPDESAAAASIVADNYVEIQGDVPCDSDGLDRAQVSEQDIATDSHCALAARVADEPAPVPCVRPFEHLAALPEDLSEAFELFKLAILRHKTEGWRQIPREDVLSTLDALKELAVAPSENRLP